MVIINVLQFALIINPPPTLLTPLSLCPESALCQSALYCLDALPAELWEAHGDQVRPCRACNTAGSGIKNVTWLKQKHYSYCVQRTQS